MSVPPKPKILMVTGEYPPSVGGVGDYTRLLSASLCDLAFDVSVVTGTSDRAPEVEEGKPSVSRRISEWGPGSLESVVREAVRVGADLVHLQYQAAAYQLGGSANLLPAYLRVRLPDVKIVTTFHDLLAPYLFPKAGPLRRASMRALDRFSHRTVVTNQADLDGLGGPAGGRRWLIRLGSNIQANPGADFDRRAWRKDRLKVDDETIVLAYFGLVNQSKGMDLLVRALAMLAKRARPVKLVIIGGEVGDTDVTNRESSSMLTGLIEQQGVADRITWTGFAPAAEVSRHLLAADICVLPFRDGASLRRGSLLAAMAHGRPTITTVPEQHEPLLRDRENVMMVPRDEVAAIADAVTAIWENPPLADRLSRGARGLSAHFSWPEVAASHARLYTSILSPNMSRG